jgi:hypothetical protein
MVIFFIRRLFPVRGRNSRSNPIKQAFSHLHFLDAHHASGINFMLSWDRCHLVGEFLA